MCGPISRIDLETKGRGGRSEEHEEHDEHEELRDSRTHTNEIHPMLTSVARRTTPIESPRKRHVAEFPERNWGLERKSLVRERE